jgi:hypothetical protein
MTAPVDDSDCRLWAAYIEPNWERYYRQRVAGLAAVHLKKPQPPAPRPLTLLGTSLRTPAAGEMTHGSCVCGLAVGGFGSLTGGYTVADMPWSQILLAAVVLGAGAFLTSRAARKRKVALFDVALRMGFGFEQKVSDAELESLGPVHLFERGHGRSAENMMRGKSRDAEVVLLDYRYTTGGGKSSHTHSQTLAIFSGAAAAMLPDFTLGPEHWWDRIGLVLGEQDIGFTANAEFSKHYLLRGPNEATIRSAFGAEALGFFAQNQGWSVESAAGALAVFRTDTLCTPEAFQPFLAEVAAVRQALVAPQTAPTPRPPDTQVAAAVVRQSPRAWVNDVRDVLSDFDAHLQDVGQRVASGQHPTGEDVRELAFFVAKLELLLNPTDEDHTKLLAAAEKALAESRTLTKDSADAFAAASLDLQQLGQLVLRKEGDTINDPRLPPRTGMAG